MSTISPKPQRGFGVIAAIVILVILAGLAAFVVSITTTQNITLAQDVMGARAYQAANAGIEYGLARWLRAAPSVAADCAPVPAQDLSPLGFSYEIAASYATDGPTGIQFCTLTSIARPIGVTAVGSFGYVEREMRVVVEGNPSP